MSSGGGPRTFPLLRTRGSHAPFIVLKVHDEPRIVRQALETGVNGYVRKQLASVKL